MVKMSRNLNGFPLDENKDPMYPECKVCPKHPSIGDCEQIDICEFEFCELITVDLYPDDFMVAVN